MTKEDADQIRIWKAALVLMDGRTMWPRAMKRAVGIIEEQDNVIARLEASYRRLSRAKK